MLVAIVSHYKGEQGLGGQEGQQGDAGYLQVAGQ